MSVSYLPPAGDALTSMPRVQSWWVEILDRNDVTLGRLDGLGGFSVEHSVGAALSASGSLTLQDVGQDVDWLTARVQPWWQVTSAGGTVAWPLGVFVASLPRTDYSTIGRSWRVDLLGKLAVLDRSRVRQSYSLPAGTVVTDAVRALIEAAGESSAAVTDSAETLSGGMVWEAGTSRLRIVNDLLAAINYFSLRPDRYGRFVAEPYVAPAARSVSRELVAGPSGMHAPAWSRVADLEVPNVVVLVSSASGDAESLVGSASNDDPADPMSTVNRGEYAVTETGVEATSQEVIDALAVRRLADLSAVVASEDVAIAPVPLDLHDALRFADQDVDTRATVQRWALSSGVDALVDLTLREVAA